MSRADRRHHRTGPVDVGDLRPSLLGARLELQEQEDVRGQQRVGEELQEPERHAVADDREQEREPDAGEEHDEHVAPALLRRGHRAGIRMCRTGGAIGSIGFGPSRPPLVPSIPFGVERRLS